jgi:hypothetical protein
MKSWLQLGELEMENIREEGRKEKDNVGGSGGGVCSSIGAIRWGYGAGGGHGKGVEKNQQRNFSIGGRSWEVDGGSSRIGKKEAEKRNKKTETENVWRVDREIEMEKVVEDSKSEEEEEEKEDDRKEDEGVSNRTEDGGKGEGN